MLICTPQASSLAACQTTWTSTTGIWVFQLVRYIRAACLEQQPQHQHEMASRKPTKTLTFPPFPLGTTTTLIKMEEQMSGPVILVPDGLWHHKSMAPGVRAFFLRAFKWCDDPKQTRRRTRKQVHKKGATSKEGLQSTYKCMLYI